MSTKRSHSTMQPSSHDVYATYSHVKSYAHGRLQDIESDQEKTIVEISRHLIACLSEYYTKSSTYSRRSDPILTTLKQKPTLSISKIDFDGDASIVTVTGRDGVERTIPLRRIVDETSSGTFPKLASEIGVYTRRLHHMCFNYSGGDTYTSEEHVEESFSPTNPRRAEKPDDAASTGLWHVSRSRGDLDLVDVSVQTENDDTQAEMKSLRRQLANMEERLSQNDAELSRNQQENRQLVELLHKLQQEKEELNAQLSQIENSLVDKTTGDSSGRSPVERITELKERIIELSKESALQTERLSENEKRTEALDAENRELLQTFEKLQAQLKNKDKEIEVLNQHIRQKAIDFQTTIDELHVVIEEKEKTLQELEQTNSVLNERMKQLETILLKLQQEKERLEAQIENLIRANTTLSKQLEELTALQKRNKEEKQKVQAEVKELQKALETLGKENSRLRTTAEGSVEDNELLLQNLRENEEKTKEAERSLKEKETELSSIREQMDSLCKERDTQKTNLKALQATLERKEAETARISEQMTSLRKENEGYHRELENLQQTLAQKTEELTRVKNESTHQTELLQKNLETTRKTLEEIIGQKRELENKIESLKQKSKEQKTPDDEAIQAQLRKQKELIQQLTQRIAELEETIKTLTSLLFSYMKDDNDSCRSILSQLTMLLAKMSSEFALQYIHHDQHTKLARLRYLLNLEYKVVKGENQFVASDTEKELSDSTKSFMLTIANRTLNPPRGTVTSRENKIEQGLRALQTKANEIAELEKVIQRQEEELRALSTPSANTMASIALASDAAGIDEQRKRIQNEIILLKKLIQQKMFYLLAPKEDTESNLEFMIVLLKVYTITSPRDDLTREINQQLTALKTKLSRLPKAYEITNGSAGSIREIVIFDQHRSSTNKKTYRFAESLPAFLYGDAEHVRLSITDAPTPITKAYQEKVKKLQEKYNTLNFLITLSEEELQQLTQEREEKPSSKATSSTSSFPPDSPALKSLKQKFGFDAKWEQDMVEA